MRQRLNSFYQLLIHEPSCNSAEHNIRWADPEILLSLSFRANSFIINYIPICDLSFPYTSSPTLTPYPSSCIPSRHYPYPSPTSLGTLLPPPLRPLSSVFSKCMYILPLGVPWWRMLKGRIQRMFYSGTFKAFLSDIYIYIF